MLATIIFSFSHHVFHSYISLVRQNAALCGNGLRVSFHNFCVFTDQIADRGERLELLVDKTEDLSTNVSINGFCFLHTCYTYRYFFLISFNSFNSLPNDKILDWSKLKAFVVDNSNVNKKLKFAVDRVENIVGKIENVGYKHFLLFPQCFQKLSLPEVLKVRIVW